MYKVGKVHTVVNMVLVSMLVVSMMPIFALPVAASELSDDSPPQFEPVTDIVQTPVRADQSKIGGDIKAAAATAQAADSERSVYIVQLIEQPVSRYTGGVEGLRPTSPKATGATKLDMSAADSVAYAEYLKSAQANFISKMNAAAGRNVEVLYQYVAALNGMAVELTAEEAIAVAALPNVKLIQPDWTETVDTDAGPAWINADDIWSGSLGIPGTMGEGIVVGVVDTGINMDHPSFADVGADGYDHTNPRGKFFGWCDPAHPNFDPTLVCNDKLIGVWSGDTDSPEDANSHGSHTASTAAGNFVENAVVNAPTISVTVPLISGVAPHANIIAYNIEGAPGTGSASGAVIIAATEQAIADQVDVINYSFGGGSADPWASAEHWFNVREAGIFVATSAGNSGSAADTIGSPANAPWVMTVGSSSHNRVFSNVLQDLSGGDTTPPADILGEGLTSGYGPAPIVYAGAIDPNNVGCDLPYAPGTFDGEIVVCDYNSGPQYGGRVNKSRNLAAGGAGGFILVNRVDWGVALMVDSYAVPGMGVSFDEGEALKAWLAGGSGHMGTIRGVESEAARGDIMAGFSSRGPNGPALDIVKPDVTAPGRRIIAAIGTTNPSDPPEFDVFQGTSMSSPHAAGAAALVRAVHPDWTPAEVQSALMTTGVVDGILKEDGVTQADPFDMGAGRINLATAALAGLVMDEAPAALFAADPSAGGDPTALNLPSLGQSSCVGTCSWTRVVRNVLDTTASWTASTTADAGMALTVSPSAFTLAPGESQELMVTAEMITTTSDIWLFGQINMTEDGGQAPDAHLTVAAQSSLGTIPDEIEIITRRDAGSYLIEGFETLASNDLTIDVFGLVEGSETTQSLVSDPTNSDPYDGNFDPLVDGTFFVTVNVPAGTKKLVAEIPDSESSDLDLFVGTGATPDAANEVCRSTSPSFNEVCEIDDPAPGDYFVLVQNWDDANGPALPGQSATLSISVLPSADLGNMTVEAPSSVGTKEPFSVRIFWDEPAMEAGDKWIGAISLGTDSGNPGNIGLVPVTILRVDDDVTKSVSNPAPAPGDVVTYTITVQPNVTPVDLNYTLVDTIPAGMTYVDGSVTGGATVSGNQVMWNGTMVVPELVYNVTTSLTDPLCDTGFGGYVNLEAFGILAQSGISGDTSVFTAFSSGSPINYYGEEYVGMGFTDDGFAIFDPGTNYAGTPWIPQAIPSVDAPSNLAAIMWQDYEIFYDAAANHGVSLATAGDAVLILEYDDLQPFGGGASIGDMEIVVYRAVDNSPGAPEIVMAYDNLAALPPIATIGLEDASGTRAAPFLNLDDPSTVLSNGLMVCYDLQGSADPVVITYQATVNDDEALCDTTLTNSVAHNTDNPGSMEAIAGADVTVDCTPPNSVLYMSTKASGPVGGLNVSDEDVIAYNTLTGEWSMVFDGSDMGLSANDVDGVMMMADGSLLLSLIAKQQIAGIGTVRDSDILHFMPTSLGSNTAGSFALYLDGSDVNLGRGSEDIDAIAKMMSGDLLLSTSGNFRVPGVGGRDEDLVKFMPTGLGVETSGTWEHYFDGSDVSLRSVSEDVDGGWINPETGDIYLTTEGYYSVRNADGSSLSGGSDDIIACAPTSLGTSTDCVWSRVWDGEAAGLQSWMGIDGFSYGDALEMVNSSATNAPGDAEEIDTIDNVDDLVEVNDENDSDAAHNADDLDNGNEDFFLPFIAQ